VEPREKRAIILSFYRNLNTLLGLGQEEKLYKSLSSFPYPHPLPSYGTETEPHCKFQKVSRSRIKKSLCIYSIRCILICISNLTRKNRRLTLSMSHHRVVGTYKKVRKTTTGLSSLTLDSCPDPLMYKTDPCLD
jgi:hypothetical protein